MASADTFAQLNTPHQDAASLNSVGLPVSLSRSWQSASNTKNDTPPSASPLSIPEKVARRVTANALADRTHVV